jgi:hypothetical protein
MLSEQLPLKFANDSTCSGPAAITVAIGLAVAADEGGLH